MESGHSQSATTEVHTPLVEVVVTEDLVADAARRLRALLADAVSLHPDQLVIDLAECGFLDATALQVLLEAHRRVWQTGGRLTLRSPSARLRRILELGRVDHVFNITPTSIEPLPMSASAGAGPGGTAPYPGTGRR